MPIETILILPSGKIRRNKILTPEELEAELEKMPLDMEKYGEELKRLEREREEYLERTKYLDET